MSDQKESIDLTKVAELIAVSIKDLDKEQLIEVLAILKETYGLEPVVQEVAVAAEVVVEEKSTFNVTLETVGPKKMQVIKAWKTMSGGSLKEIKVQVDSAPVLLRENISKDEAEAIKAALEEVDAEVSIH